MNVVVVDVDAECDDKLTSTHHCHPNSNQSTQLTLTLRSIEMWLYPVD